MIEYLPSFFPDAILCLIKMNKIQSKNYYGCRKDH